MRLTSPRIQSIAGGSRGKDTTGDGGIARRYDHGID
jgi:hypothetical protein